MTDCLQRCLQPGERVLWRGKPEIFPFWTSENAPIILAFPAMLAVWGVMGFVLYSILTAGVSTPWPVLAALLAAMVPLALWMGWIGLGQWLAPWILLRRTAYLITDKRILRQRGRQVDALDLLHLPEITLCPERDGHGSLLIGRHPMEMGTSYHKGVSEYHIFRKEPFALWYIPEAERVLALLKRLPEQAPSADSPLPEEAERVLWQGKPAHVPLTYQVQWAHLPTLLAAGALLAALLALFLSDGPAWQMALAALAAMALPLYFGVGQYVRLHHRLRRTEYVLTNRGVIRLCGKDVQSCKYGGLPALYMTIHPDGSGTILLSTDYLGHEHRRDTNLLRILTLPRQLRLDCIPEVSRVWQLLHNEEAKHAA